MSKVLTMIIVNTNEAYLTKRCVDSIFSTYDCEDTEIIIVDNNSHPADYQIIETLCERNSKVRSIKKKNEGYGSAVNKGIKSSNGEYFLILNPDMVAIDDSIQSLLSFIQSKTDAGLVAPKLLNPNGTIQYSCRSFYSMKTLFARRAPLFNRFLRNENEKHLMSNWEHNTTATVDWALGTGIIVPREVLQKVGPFDTRFKLYFDDVDLCLRMWQNNWKVYYYPESIFIHDHIRTSAKRIINRAKIEHFKSMIRFYRKHGISYLFKPPHFSETR